jgi:TRAP-type C4-dicarboxylate transport system permease small subunit
VWSKDGVPPAAPVNAPQIPPHWQGLMWGTLPFGSSLLAIFVVLALPERQRRRAADVEPAVMDKDLVPGRMFS